MAVAEALRHRLLEEPIVGVVGLGYVGLPLAVAFAESGAPVIGVDLDAARVEGVMAGRSYVEDVPSDRLGSLVADKHLRATSEVDSLAEADAVVICVPTPLGKSKEPDISFIVGAADAVAAPDLAAYDLVLILTAHASYDWKAIVDEATLVVDTRNATDGLDTPATVIRL